LSATPVFTEDAVASASPITIDLRPDLAEIASSARSNGRVYIVNQDGDYLLNPEPTREFGFDLGQRYRLQDDFPDLAAALASGDVVSRQVRDSKGENVALSLVPFHLAQGPLIAIVETVPVAEVLGSASAVQRATLLGGAIVALLRPCRFCS
jgi:hypothetical protein